MRAKSMILIMIALGCGLVASIGISQHLERGKQTGEASETEKIFVAMAAIDIGQPLTAENVKLEEWPKTKIPQGAVMKLEDLKDRYPRQRLYAGEPILEAKLMDNNEADSTKIPAGYRVASVSVTMETGVAGLVQPGDRVDLVVYLKRNQDVHMTGVKTILRDVRVFAVNQETERTTDKDGQAIIAKTVSFLVTPAQVERLMLAGQLGKLHLSLRRPNDEQSDDSLATGGLTVDQLLGSDQLAMNDATPEIAPAPANTPGLLDWLNKQVEAAPITAPAAEEPAWKMIMYTPQGTRQFQWQSEASLPEEVGGAAAAPAPGAVTPAPIGGGSIPSDPAHAALIGQPFTAEGTTSGGSVLQSSAFKGKVVLVTFWSNNCEKCRAEIPTMRTLNDQFKLQGVEILGVNLDPDGEAVDSLIESLGLPWPNVTGSDAQQIADRYGVRSVPTVMLVNQQGIVVAVDSSAARLAEQAAQLAQGGIATYDQ